MSRWIAEFRRGAWKRCVRCRLEQRGEPHPDGMLPDGSLETRPRGR